jgi:outer membrane protein OmpA-like peptidoglycan-associated protein
MRFRVALLAAAGLTVSAAAYAQTPGPVDGWYAHLGVGYNYLNSVPVDSVQLNNGSTVDLNSRNINYGSGVTGEFGPGYGFGNGFRIDLNGTFSFNNVNENGGGRSCTNNCPYNVPTLHSGDERKFGTLVNGYYDFTDAFGPGITPYVGGGVGFQNIRQNDVRVTGVFQGGPYDHDGWQLTGSSSKTTFAYDGLAGVKFRLDSVDPNLSLYLEGRYLGTSGTRTYTATFQTVGYKAQHNVSLGNEGNESAIIGVEYAFASPPPPPPPPPPPAPPPAPQVARTYLVFFDWDRADLSARAQQIVAEAAQASTHTQTTKIEVNGYTDLSGTAAYNQKLSVRRAESVEAELVKDGVAQGEIEIHGYGESNPLVPTAKGVREPQNRRVEIILQ